jgi:hypothetical protein
MTDGIHDRIGLGALILHALGPGASVTYYERVLRSPGCRVAHPLHDMMGVDDFLAAVPRIVEACDGARAVSRHDSRAAEATAPSGT